MLISAFEQLPGNFFQVFFSISRNFTKYYLHAKFQINWTTQTEIKGGHNLPSPGHTNLQKARVKHVISGALRPIHTTQFLVTTCSIPLISQRMNSKIAATLVNGVKETTLSLHVGPTSCY